MTSPKGYPVEGRRDDTDTQEINLQSKHSTVIPKGNNRRGLDTIGGGFAEIVADAVIEVGSTNSRIVITGHVFRVGDLVRIKTTANGIIESELFVDSIFDANTIILAGAFSADLVAADTIDILRYVSPKVASDGSSLATTVSAPIRILKGPNGVFTEVEITKDTADISQTQALPVEIVGVNGTEINITAGDINVQTSHVGANADSMRVGDGVTEWGIEAVTKKGLVKDVLVETAVNAVLAKIIAAPATEAKQDTNILGIIALQNELELKADLTETQPVSIASQPLPTGAATLAQQVIDNAVLDAILVELALKADLLDTQPVSATSLPLPAGASTEATLASVLAKIIAAPSTEAKQDTQIANELLTSAKLPASLGQGTKSQSMTVVLASDSDNLVIAPLDNISFVRLEMTSSNILSGAYTELIANVGGTAIRKIKLFMSSGTPLLLAVGAGGSEIDKAIIPAGGYSDGVLEVNIPAGSRLSVKSLGATVSAGEIIANLMG